MGRKKIDFKKSATTATELIATLLFVMALFYGSFYFISDNYDSANIPLDQKFQNSLNNITETQDTLDTNSQEIKSSVTNITEADGTDLFVAYNGLKGVPAAISSLWSLVDTTITLWQSLVPGMDFLPGWVSSLIFIFIIFFIIFTIFRIFTGRQDI